ncbi:unnamed protein product [Parascedosporium putredinis]|uniref:Prion-inhibition and propagation HeLo domain-containing protein n=1 Tax=Parascedosporium putredinis TaxID=1442378 RepID=A0A9P1H2T5_9PEZI|nr:unnamed protein product [Parascedosporium putredinis]CAI7994361.1 unnamed protein product [Parascedosporium putredinis]
MAEAAGLALGVVSFVTAVSGVFVSVVECFEYVQLGRSFGKDYEKSQVRLAALKLELTRWGVSVGILPDPATGVPRQVAPVESKIAAVVVRLLESVRDDVVELQRKSQRYRDDAIHGNDGRDVEIAGVESLTAASRILESRSTAVIEKRLEKLSLRKKVSWALYEKKHFDRILDDITELFTRLESLLPAEIKPYQQSLCVYEVEEIQEDQPEQVLTLLHEAAAANGDKLLKETVEKALVARGTGHTWERTEVGDQVQLEQGDRIASGSQAWAPIGRVGHNYGVTVGKGSAKIYQGDSYL